MIYFLFFLTIANAYLSFEDFISKYDKAYSTQEYAQRKQIYTDRISSFENITEYKPGVNERSDWSEEEIEGLLNLKTFPLEQQLNKVGSSSNLDNSRLGLPSKLDWREKNAVTSIKNQGKCGCCWSFASVAYAESKMILSDPKFTVGNTDLSEQYVLECTKDSDCSGGYIEFAIQSALKIPNEQIYPYAPQEKNPGICSEFGVNIGSVATNHYSLTDKEIIALLQDGPVVAAISSEGWLNYESGVFQCNAKARVNHAVLLVGYTESYWIVKNQWGFGWGEEGYIRVTRESKRNCRIGNAIYLMKELNFIVVPILLILIWVF